jgi:hypothetical protein
MGHHPRTSRTTGHGKIVERESNATYASCPRAKRKTRAKQDMVNGSKEEQEEPPKIQLTIDNEVQSHQQGRRCLLSQ